MGARELISVSEMPIEIPAYDERYVVQLNGKASRSRLPPYEISTIGLHKLNIPNPYLDKSDNSKVWDDNCYANAYAMDNKFPNRVKMNTGKMLIDSPQSK